MISAKGRSQGENVPRKVNVRLRSPGRRARRSLVLIEAVESRLLLCYLHEVGGTTVTTDTDGPFVPMGPLASAPIAPTTGPALAVAPSSADLTSWSTTAS